MPKRPCLGVDGRYCGRLTDRPDHRCPACAAQWNAARDARRGTTAGRGYGHRHQTNRARILAASRVCWLCGHGGADQADDVIPKAAGGASTLANLRPAHGTEPCPTCGVRCNQSRGSRTPTQHYTQ
jgi:5-methylcytosine-specific restriction endonuclease McrA